MKQHEAIRDHLFISYATEDGDLAEWLAMRLTSEGYRVWCDKTHLLGGESYPEDIDRAIKDRTFRLLALLSQNSLRKPNPRKERTLALNIGREQNLDFLIPLNVEGLSATELDWMTSDLTFIPFHHSWADGFARLLKKLKDIGAPNNVSAGRATACDWIAIGARAATRSERLWVNLLPVLELPRVLHKFELKDRLILPKLAERWPFHRTTRSPFVWSFCPPPAELEVSVDRLASVSWQDVREYDKLQIQDVSLSVLRKAITVKCLSRGMKLVPRSGSSYFPPGLINQDHLPFTSYSGKRSYVSAVGERTFRRGDQREQLRYHLAPSFHLASSDHTAMTVRVAIRLHLTDLNGYPLEGSKIISRRKRICKNWWNHEWASRFLAVAEWLCEGQSECEVLHTTDGCFRINATPLSLCADQGIDETSLQSVIVEEDTEIDEDIATMEDDFSEYEDEEDDGE